MQGRLVAPMLMLVLSTNLGCVFSPSRMYPHASSPRISSVAILQRGALPQGLASHTQPRRSQRRIRGWKIRRMRSRVGKRHWRAGWPSSAGEQAGLGRWAREF